MNGSVTVVLCCCLPFNMTYTGTQNARGEVEFKDTYGGWQKWTLTSFNASAKRAEYSYTSVRKSNVKAGTQTYDFASKTIHTNQTSPEPFNFLFLRRD